MPVAWTRRKVESREMESESDADTDDEGATARDWDDGPKDHVYPTPDLIEETVAPVAIVRDGGIFTEEKGGGEALLAEVTKRVATEEGARAVNGAIVMSCVASIELLAEEFPACKQQARVLTGKHEVQVTPQFLSRFDDKGYLPRVKQTAPKTSVRMSTGERVEHFSSGWEQSRGEDGHAPGEGSDIFSLQLARGTDHLGYWAPRGVHASSRGLSRIGSKKTVCHKTF